MKMQRWRLLVPTVLWCLAPSQGTVQLYSSPVMRPSSRGDAISPEAVISDFNYSSIVSLAPFQSAARTGPAGDSSVELYLPQTNGRVATIRGTVNSIHRIPESPGTYRISGSAPLDPSNIATFSLYVDTVQKLVMGDLVADDDNWYRFETKGDVRVNRIPRESAICVMNEAPALETRQLEASNGDRGTAHARPKARPGRDERHQHKHHKHHKHGHRKLAHPPHEHHVGGLHKASAASPAAGTGSGQAGRKLQGSNPFLIYIDADVTTDPDIGRFYSQWSGVSSISICGYPSAERMAKIMNMVREDYAPFDVTVTSDRAVYYAWADNKIRVGLVSSVKTGVISIGGSTCGVAYLDRIWMRDNLAWVVLCNGACGASDELIGQTISHEVGHAFNLQHDGSFSDGSYLRGLPSNGPASWPYNKRWNTIMGLSGNFGITQWSRGEYPGYTSSQGNPDDLQVIRNAVGSRPNAYCDQAFPLQQVVDGAPYVFDETAFSCGGGTHNYTIEFKSAGRIGIQVSTLSETNLKFEVALFGGTGTTVETFVPSELATARGSNNAYDSSTVTLNSAIFPGLYLIRIRSVAQTANNEVDGAAFPAYGSMGFYTLSLTGPSNIPGPTSLPDPVPTPIPATPGPTTPAPITPAPTTPSPTTPSPTSSNPTAPDPTTPAPSVPAATIPAPTPAPTTPAAAITPVASPPSAVAACIGSVCGCGYVCTSARRCKPQMKLSMRFVPLTIKAGETTTLTLTVHNNGKFSVPFVTFSLYLDPGLRLQSADSGISFQATSGAIVLDLIAGMPALAVQTYSVRIQALSTAAPGSRHLVECIASTYGVSSARVKQRVRIGR